MTQIATLTIAVVLEGDEQMQPVNVNANTNFEDWRFWGQIAQQVVTDSLVEQAVRTKEEDDG